MWVAGADRWWWTKHGSIPGDTERALRRGSRRRHKSRMRGRDIEASSTRANCGGSSGRRIFCSPLRNFSVSPGIMHRFLFLFVAAAGQAAAYPPPGIEQNGELLASILVRDMINQMLVDAADSYMEDQDKPKEVPIELPADYDGIDTLNPNPSIRDQEYLRHSTLWSHQRFNNNENANNKQRVKPGSVKIIKDEKENTLPAYCTPPNPCPVGYTSKNNCIENFENTASFSRDYQSAQDCMCDREHMLECSVDSANSNSISSMHITNSNFNQIVDQFQGEDNPFLRGEKLPIAAKKGLNVF